MNTELLTKISDWLKAGALEGPAWFAWYNNPDGDRIRFVRANTITALEEENKRLREALGKVRDGYGPNHLSKYARDIASAALKGE
jgi:hypothetical protein